MPVEIACECGQHFRARDEDAGRRGRCPRCGRVMVIPGGTSLPVALPTPSQPLPPRPSYVPAGPHAPFASECPTLYSEYGVPYATHTRAEARALGLRYFGGRWVPHPLYGKVRAENAVVQYTKSLFALACIGTGLLLLMLLVLMIANAPSPILGGLALALVLGGGNCALWYGATQWNQVCRWILVGLNGLNILGGFYGLILDMSESGAGYQAGGFLFSLLICGLIIWLLACPSASRLYNYNQTH